MVRITRTLAGWAVLWLATAYASAAVPQTITFQGLLTDSAGDPVPDGSYLVKFIIWDDPVSMSPGAVLWDNGFQNLSTADGLFTYELGSDVALPDVLFAADTVRYLGITVNGDPEMTPRTRLTSQAYSYQALRSDTADNAQLLNGQAPSYYLNWNNLAGMPAGFADGIDHDAGGDITSVAAGTGLDGGGTSGAVNLQVDPTDLFGTNPAFDSWATSLIVTGGTADTTLTSTSLTVPGPGRILAIASVDVGCGNGCDLFGERVQAYIGITSGPGDATPSTAYSFLIVDDAITTASRMQVFAPPVAGTYTYYVRGRRAGGTGSSVIFARPQLALLFIPN